MNERIKSLVYEAEKYALDKANDHDGDEDYENTFEDDFQEKFAELLFNEIANTAVVSDGMFNGNERRLSVELRLGDMVKKISVLGFEE